MGIGIGELEKKVKEVLEKNQNDTVELLDLSETTYEQLKNIFETNYEVRAIINILKIGSKSKNYTLHIRKR